MLFFSANNILVIVFYINLYSLYSFFIFLKLKVRKIFKTKIRNYFKSKTLSVSFYSKRFLIDLTNFLPIYTRIYLTSHHVQKDNTSIIYL